MDILKLAKGQPLPPMPKPQDFGITDEDWAGYEDCRRMGSHNKVKAYKEAVQGLGTYLPRHDAGASQRVAHG